jgi:hypothetical protein
MEREPVTVSTTLDTLYRLDFGEEGIDEGVLQRIVCNSEKMSAGDQILYDARGLQLLDLNNEDVEAAGGLDDVLEDLVKAGTQDVTLLLVPCQNPELAARQKKSVLAAPAEVVTDLREDVMQPLLKKKSLAKVPLGSCMYLDHPNWKLTGLGALVMLKPGCLKELDLRDNDLTDVGGGLCRFEALQELRLGGNKLRQVELTYMPRLTWLDLSFNRLTALPELLGLPVLQYIDLSDNEVGTRGGASDEPQQGPTVVSGESPDGWERLAHSPLLELRHLLLANNLLDWGQAQFNARMALLREKRALQELDLRGNPMTFPERPLGKAPLIQYREWVLTQCSGLKKLDKIRVSGSERERIRRAPLEHEPGDDGEGGEGGGGGGGDGEEGGDGGDEMLTRFEYDGPNRTSLLAVHAELLHECLSLSNARVGLVLTRVQQSLHALLDVPPNRRTLFEQATGPEEVEERADKEGLLDMLDDGKKEEEDERADEPPDAERKRALRMRIEGESALKAEHVTTKLGGGGGAEEEEEEAPEEEEEEGGGAVEEEEEEGGGGLLPSVQLEPADVIEQVRDLPRAPPCTPALLPSPACAPTLATTPTSNLTLALTLALTPALALSRSCNNC